MNEKCEVVWTANCRSHPPAIPRKKTGEYVIQHRFGLRYYPDRGIRVEIGDKDFEGLKGSYFCILPDAKFHISYLKGSSNGQSGYFDITFLVHDPTMEKRLRQFYPPRLAGESEKNMLNYIIENWHRQDAEVRSNCNSFLTALLLLLFAEQTKPEALGSQFILTEGYSRATLCALDFVERNYLSRFTLDELARDTGYNRNYLCMSFSKNVGIPIVTYTNFLRIRKAIGTILYFPEAIGLISESLAFGSPNYFGRTFKAFIGISPQEFNRVARKMTPEEKADLYASEPLLKYRRCPIEEMTNSMRHIGDIFKARAQELK